MPCGSRGASADARPSGNGGSPGRAATRPSRRGSGVRRVRPRRPSTAPPTSLRRPRALSHLTVRIGDDDSLNCRGIRRHPPEQVESSNHEYAKEINRQSTRRTALRTRTPSEIAVETRGAIHGAAPLARVRCCRSANAATPRAPISLAHRRRSARISARRSAPKSFFLCHSATLGKLAEPEDRMLQAPADRGTGLATLEAPLRATARPCRGEAGGFGTNPNRGASPPGANRRSAARTENKQEEQKSCP
jgi:hypothetical protein